MDYMAIGRRVRKVRKMRGMSQEALAELVDISTTHMSHIETATTKLGLPVLAALARELSVSTDYLLYGCKENAHEEVDVLLESCSERQLKILAEIVKGTKAAFDRYDVD
ncbi:MAG: helix-turn-helix transcriptional regulator [Oscillospiraceae bacterium]|nr:helix-turn-helix transcriptional regulator [Oscillospiraceae bacterium]